MFPWVKPLASNAAGVGASFAQANPVAPVCIACGSSVVVANCRRAQPHRCASCKAQRQREYQKRYHAKTRRKVEWGDLTCQRCKASVRTVPRRGRPPDWCRSCQKIVKAEQSVVRRKQAIAENRHKPHACNCVRCGKDFQSCRKKQKYCSYRCVRPLPISITCQRCRVTFEIPPGNAGDRKFCSKACFHAEHCAATTKCQHCSKQFARKAYATQWQGKNKFCSRDCYLDSRWGDARKRQPSSAAVVKRASGRALATSLKARCKKYGVPFDPACTREAVCERDNWVCQDCGIKCHVGRHRFDAGKRKSSKRNAEHDHIVPLGWRLPNKGNTFDNSQCLCRKCNGRKGSRRAGQPLFPEMATP
jgi:hypothetical protein